MTGVRRRPLAVLAIAVIAVALAGCGSRLREERLEREERINVPPVNARADIVAAVHAYVSDPANIRSAFVTEPAIVRIGRQKRYAACVRFSARNSVGRYAGRDMLAIFSAGRFDQFIDASASTDPASRTRMSALVKEVCGAAEYKRFPELEAMKR